MTKHTPSNKQQVPAIKEQIALYSLNRHGNILLDTYLKNKAYPDSIIYQHPLLKVHLQNTYGVLIYHEQLMNIVQDFSKLSKEDANEIRKALGKKDANAIDSYFVKFKNGCLLNADFVEGCKQQNPEYVVAELWQLFYECAVYMFSYNSAAQEIEKLNKQ